MKKNIKSLHIKYSDIKKALGYLTLGSDLAVVRKNKYALEAKHLDGDSIVLTVHKENVMGSQQYFHFADFIISKNELMEVLYA